MLDYARCHSALPECACRAGRSSFAVHFIPSTSRGVDIIQRHPYLPAHVCEPPNKATLKNRAPCWRGGGSMPYANNRTGQHHAATSDKPKSVVGRNRLMWRSNCGRLFLYFRNGCPPLAVVEPDRQYPSLFRIRFPDGHISDLLNLARAKDAAALIAVRSLNSLALGASVARLPFRGTPTRVGHRYGRAKSSHSPRSGFLAERRQ